MAQVNLPDHEATDPGEGGSFEVMPQGYYRASVKRGETRQSKAGNECINLIMEVLEGEYAGSGFFNQLVFTPWDGQGEEPFNLKRARWFLKSAGVSSTGAVDTEVLAKQLEGHRLTVKLDIETWEGKERNKVVGVHPYNWEPEDRAGAVANSQTNEPVDLSPDENFF